MSFRFLVKDVATIAGLTTLEGTLLEGTIHHGAHAVTESDDRLPVKVKTVAFVTSSSRDPTAKTLTIERTTYASTLLIGKTISSTE